MSFVVVGGVPIPVAPGGGKADWLDAVDRARAMDNTYRASATGNAKRDWHFSTPPVSRDMAAIYRAVLKIVSGQVCSGDVLEGSENLVLQSENFGTTWGVDGTPVRNAADIIVGGIVLDSLADDSAVTLEGYKQTIAFTGNGVKTVSGHARQVTSTSTGVRLRDNSAGTDRLLGALTWSGGLPVLTMSVGTFLGYDTLGAGVFRIKLATSSVTAANANELGIYPASVVPLAGGSTGAVDIGGVQAENGAVPTPYAKTTTATVNTLTPTCCCEITGWTPVKAASDFRYVLDFALHET